MRKIFAGLLFCAFWAGCTSAPSTESEAVVVPSGTSTAGGKAAIAGFEWQLEEIRLDNRLISLDAFTLEAGFYSLTFDGEGRLSGLAAPNRYSAPCDLGDDGSVSIGLAVSTKMASLHEPEALKEHEYFEYLSKISLWGLTSQGRLELSTAAPDGGAAVMVLNRKP